MFYFRSPCILVSSNYNFFHGNWMKDSQYYKCFLDLLLRRVLISKVTCLSLLILVVIGLSWRTFFYKQLCSKFSLYHILKVKKKHYFHILRPLDSKLALSNFLFIFLINSVQMFQSFQVLIGEIMASLINRLQV